SKSLVELMGGSIGVTSEEGKGSEFSFVVGLSRDTETGVVALPSVVAPGTRGRALLVEGNVSQRMAVRGILIRDGWTVDEVSGCREAEALDASQVACYDLAIVDCTQSDGCGVTLARDLSAASGLQTPLPCVMLCTLGDETATREIRAETAPPVPMLLKPVDASELRAAIEQALTGSVVPAADAGTDATPLTPSTLPSPETEAAPPPVESPAPARRELRVLLAEDAPINQKLAEAVLRRMGHEVTVARNGVEAVSLVQEQRFDIVLMDIQMPEMGGVEATERIRHFEMAKGMARIPIVAVTANALKGDRENYLAAGMDGYVSKPIVFAALEAEIERVTRGV
ncbi:MAG TPA: response regulator, partial [Burkholderiaceae bacterium]|nr:response regulator [Burkholderiaceae bacterium]